MQFQFSGHQILFAAALFLGGAVSAFGEGAADGAGQTQSSEYDFTVVTADKDQTHPYYGQGSELGFVVNGVQGRSLVLVRGKTYTFKVDTEVMHDFYLSTNPKGWGIGTLTAGVQGNFTYRGVVTFQPTAETPDLVYYGCRNHKYMGGDIHIVNPGEEGKFQNTKPPAVETP